MAIAGKKVLMISIMRDEGPYILEWLAHHFALGVDDLLIFTNDCTDNTSRIFDRLEVMMPHRIKHQPNPKVMFPDRGKWWIMALRYAGLFGRVQDAEWVYVTDADEFLNFKRGITTFDGFFDATGPADAVSFTSVAFNSNGHKHATRDIVPKRYTQTTNDFKAAAKDGASIKTAVKTLYRNALGGRRRPHRPVTPDFSKTGMKWINGSGGAMPPEWTDDPGKAIEGNGTRRYAQLNHYSIKSAEEFLIKVERGDSFDPNRLGSSEQYWSHANRVGNTDKTLTALTPEARALYDEFMSDPTLAALHEESFALRSAKLQTILNSEAGDKLARAIGYYG